MPCKKENLLLHYPSNLFDTGPDVMQKFSERDVIKPVSRGVMFLEHQLPHAIDTRIGSCDIIPFDAGSQPNIENLGYPIV